MRVRQLRVRTVGEKRVLSYHFNWAECNNGVTTPAVGPGIPARILPLLKHVLLPLTVGLLVSHPSGGAEEGEMGVSPVQPPPIHRVRPPPH